MRNNLARHGGLDVAAGLGGQVDGDGPRRHALYHVARDQHRRAAARHERSRDDDVDLATLHGDLVYGCCLTLRSA